MENREQQILSEMTSLIESIKSQLAFLEEKLSDLQQIPSQTDAADIVPIDIEIVEDEGLTFLDNQLVEDEIVHESVDLQDDDDLPFFEEPGSEPEPEPEPEPESVFESVHELELKPEPEIVLDSVCEPELKPEPEIVLDSVCEPEQEPKAESVVLSRMAMVDAMASRQAWRTDMPGLAVKDIRSAISLNDRLVFINYLFNEDPMAFQDALNRINASRTLDETVAMLAELHPEWDFESEVVYRFMMAVRRKIR